jgi:hypothetical protein
VLLRELLVQHNDTKQCYLESCWCSTTIQNSVPALQLSSINQSTSLNERQRLSELRVICTTDSEGSRIARNVVSSAPTTKGRNQCAKIGHHERSKFRTWKFTNLENAAAWSVPAPEPCVVHPCVRCEVLNSDTVTLYLRNVSLDIDGEGSRY